MVKMQCVTDAFLETCLNFTEQLFYQTFSDVSKAKARAVHTWWCSLTL